MKQFFLVIGRTACACLRMIHETHVANGICHWYACVVIDYVDLSEISRHCQEPRQQKRRQFINFVCVHEKHRHELQIKPF